MPDTKLTALSAISGLTLEDIMYVVDDPGGTPVSKKITIGALFAILNAPEGMLINGKIVPSVSSNNLIVAIKGLDGNDPSASNPVYCRIGSTIRAITTALSKTRNAGTNALNMGSAELAAKEVDLFVYLGYSTTENIVTLIISRIPYAQVYGDFVDSSTDPKGVLSSAVTLSPDAADSFQNVGRFAATLSAGAGYTWTVPTFTSKNLVQRPIYETRLLSYLPSWTGTGGTPSLGNGTLVGDYMIRGRIVDTRVKLIWGSTTTANTATENRMSKPIEGIALQSGVAVDPMGVSNAFDSSASLIKIGHVFNNNTTSVGAYMEATSGSVSLGYLQPFTWAQSDCWSLSFRDQI